MDRNEKLAAARRKLENFQKTKTVKIEVQPNNEKISRNPIEPQDTNPPGHINGNHICAIAPSPGGNSFMTQNSYGTNSLSALEQVELEATRNQLAEQTLDLTNIKEKLTNSESQIQAITEENRLNTETLKNTFQSQINILSSKNSELQQNLEDFQQIIETKNGEILVLKQKNSQTEAVAQQLNNQLTQLQSQIDLYKQQVEQHDFRSVSNQQQLSGRVQQQEMTIQILVEEKAELNTRVRQLEEVEINFKNEIESFRINGISISQNMESLNLELRRLKESESQNSSIISQRDNDLRTSQQTIAKLRSELGILKLREEDSKFINEQFQGQLNQSFSEIKNLNEQKNMAEAALTQVSSGSETIIQERNRLLEQINEIQVRYEQNRFQLEEVSLERDQLQNQNKATVDKAQNAINEISQKLQDSIAENQNLSEAINNLKNNETKKADSEDRELDQMNDLLANQTETLVEIQERLKLEIAAREHGEVKVQEIRREKEQLFQIIQEHKDTAEAFQRRCAELEERQIQSRILLESADSDKHMISRAMKQNNDMKQQFEELKNQLVIVINEKAEITVERDTLKHRNTIVEEMLEEKDGVEMDKNEWRERLEGHEKGIVNLRNALEKSELEHRNILRENTELREALQSARENSKIIAQQQVEAQQSNLDTEFEHVNSTVAPSNEQVVKLEATISELENERGILTGQLVEAKQKQLKLLEKVDGAMERPAPEDFTALKSAKQALETKFVEIIKQNASIKDENEKLEALVHQLNAETDTIIEYVALYRDQRSALARKDKQRKDELEQLGIQRNEVQTRVDELELLLKSTVQNIRPMAVKADANREAQAELSFPDKSDRLTESYEEPDQETENKEDSQTQNIDKILSLLDEIRDPYQGYSIPAMIGVEYAGPLYVI